MKPYMLCLAPIAVLVGPMLAPADVRGEGATTAAIMVIVEEGGKRMVKALKSLSSEHKRVYPDGDTMIVPMVPSLLSGETRVGLNFDHRSWVPRGSKPVKVRITFHGVSDEILKKLRVGINADKGGRQDRPRCGGGVFANGDTFTLSYGTGGDRAYYLVARDGFLKSMLPESGAFAKLERLN
jgi:hypothetical protein